MTSQQKLAILIDAENVSAQIIEPLFKEINKLGTASVKRIYGDWTSNQLAQWKPILLPHAIEPKQQFSYTKGKNASDIAMVIDAMDLLHSHKFDAVCLISSDSDFTPLVIRIQQEGINVFGFGQKKSPEPFVNACHQFIYLEDIVNNQVQTPTAANKKIDAASRAFLKAAIAEYEDAEGWANVGHVGKFLRTKIKDFNVADYGCKNLSNWIRSCGGQFDLRVENSVATVKIRANKNKPKPVAPTATTTANPDTAAIIHPTPLQQEPWDKERLNAELDFKKILRQSIYPLQNEQGWATMAQIEQALQEYDWQQYGHAHLKTLLSQMNYIQQKDGYLSVSINAKQVQLYLDSIIPSLADEDGWVSCLLLAERLAQIALFNAPILGYTDALDLILKLNRENYAFMTLYGQRMLKPKSDSV